MFELAFIAAIGIVLWSLIVVVQSRDLNVRAKCAFALVLCMAAVAAYWCTFHYQYFSNPNTHVHGWPIPIVIFQRENPEAEWMDYVGWTTILGLPMNVIAFTLFPSLLFLILAYWRRLRFAGVASPDA